MKSYIFSLLFACTAGITFCACNTTSSVAAFHTPEVECLGAELDGSQTLRTFGRGNTKKDAIEQARKNAVRAVIFKGIRSGFSECNKLPLIHEVNAEEKYSNYFHAFFKDGGEYTRYVNNEDEKKWSKSKNSTKNFVAYTITVRVLRSELEQRLRADRIIK